MAFKKGLVGSDYSAPDLYAKITGRARYSEDFRAEGMLFAKLLLSPMPHCRVKNVDVSAALAMEGVEAVLRASDFPEGDPLGEQALTDEPLYEGQPILAVAAVSETIAADAIEKIKLELEPLPFALDPMVSLRPGGPNARTEGNTMVMKQDDQGRRMVVEDLKWKASDFEVGPEKMPMGEAQDEWSFGDLDKGFEEADFIIEQSFYHQSLSHHPLEPRSCMAYWQNGKVYVHGSTQSVARTLGPAAGAIGVTPGEVVFVGPFCGGGFGSKIVGSVNMAIPALLSKKTGRPVMHRVTRYEENYFGRARPALHVHAKVGWKKDGRVSAIDMFVVQDNGPYGRQSDMGGAPKTASLAYQPEAMRYRGVSVLTNTPPRAPQRAPGGAHITGMMEPMMDRAAEKLGIDRLEIRKINAPRENATYEADRGRNVTTAYVHEALDILAEKVDWEAAKKRSKARNGSKITGVGICTSNYTAGASGFDGLMVLRTDGSLTVHSGIGNLGTHSYSDTARVAADVLGLPWEKLNVVWGDTSKHLPWSTVSAGSMTTASTSRAVHAAAMDAKRKLQEIAARDLGGSPDSYDTEDGRVFRKGNRAVGMSFARAAERALALGGRYDGHELPEDIHAMTQASASALAGQGLMGVAKDNYERAGDIYSFVAGFAEVEVDTGTGEVELKHYCAVTDCGTVMNPRSLGAQLHGGGVQGFGLARSQRWVYDPKWGIPFAHRFYTARPPGILDVPSEMDWGAVDKPDPLNPVGSKGIGEPPVGAGAAALLCALQDALGEDILKRTPVMTDNLLRAIEGMSEPSYTDRSRHT